MDDNAERIRLQELKKLAASYIGKGVNEEALRECDSSQEMLAVYSDHLQGEAQAEIDRLEGQEFAKQESADLASAEREVGSSELDDEGSDEGDTGTFPVVDSGVSSASRIPETTAEEWSAKVRSPQGRREFESNLKELIKRDREKNRRI